MRDPRTSTRPPARRRRAGTVRLLLIAACLAGGCGGGALREPTPEPVAAPAPAPEEVSVGTPIHRIQGAGHVSPLLGRTLEVVDGVVVAVAKNGFYLEEPAADQDDDDATSEGIFVYAGAPPDLWPGDLVEVRGATVSEYGNGDLTNTELVDGVVVWIEGGREIPAPVLVGSGGRVPPGAVIDDDGMTRFDPVRDGIDFLESLEGMLVVLNRPAAVGATNVYGETPVVAGDGVAGPRTANGGIAIRDGDLNPERIFLDDALVPDEPKVLPGDRFDGEVVGVVTYSFSNYKLLNVLPLPAVIDGGTRPRSATLAKGPDDLLVATFNVENLDPGDFNKGRAKGPALAEVIVDRLGAPDVLALEEVQDESGSRNDGTVSAAGTLERLVAAVVAAGGPEYRWAEIPPVDDADGGAPGSNIRVAILYDPDRVNLVARPAPPDDPSVTPVAVVDGESGPDLSFNPGRVAPDDPAWSTPEQARRPLAAEFEFRGRRFFVVACHFKSRREDDPLFGKIQPPRQPTSDQRAKQGAVVNGFVGRILATDPGAAVIVLGDMNDFDFGIAVQALKGDHLLNLVDRIPGAERYTYVYEGNSQCLDHILVSRALETAEAEVVHCLADFLPSGRASDHDPVLARFRFR